MKRSISEENGEAKRPFLKQECVNIGYESTYPSYTSASPSPSTVAQPLPGQPPLPPMPPPPPSTAPPPPHIFGPVPSQITPIQAWTHPPTTWQWITPQGSPLPSLPPREMTASSFQRELPLRNNYMRRERFAHAKSNMYIQRNNFHRKNRRATRYGQTPGQFDQAAAYFGTALSNSLGLEWQRNSYTTSTGDTIVSHMPVPLPNHSLPPMPPIVANRHIEETVDQDVKPVLEEVAVKKSKQRKPMSQSYPSRPWNREDAERALKIENEYNKSAKAQSLIIKFPDPDLNKDIVREFHPGIQNIHFQSPSGPRYCFIQMAESIDLDEAIKDLEKIPFGIGHLKVEKKSLRDEDNPTPEEIDPYTLYIGNLPESVNVNEVKSKFPTAVRMDVGHAQKMRNTRYAFIRYNTVDESISAYKEAHDLMWDTRSIIVRFRRQRGNTCLPGEPKPNVKKLKEETSNISSTKKDQQSNHVDKKTSESKTDTGNRLQDGLSKVQNNASPQIQEQSVNLQSSSSPTPTSIAPAKSAQQQQQQPWTAQTPQIPSASEAPPPCSTDGESVKETMMLTEIKEEPVDYEEMDMACNMRSDDDIDDDDDDDDDDVEEEEEDSDEDDYEEDNGEEDANENGSLSVNNKEDIPKDNEPSDHLDQMFSEIENMTGDIGF